MVVVEEERRARGDAALQERTGTAVVLAVHLALERGGELLVLQRLDATRAGVFVHVGVAVPVPVVPGVIGPQAFVVRARGRVPLVEAVVAGPAPVLRADVPLAEAGRGVAGLGQDVSHGPFPGDDPAVVAA